MARTAAVEFLFRRVAMTPRDYRALDPADKPAAFTIPDVDSRDVIERIQRELLVSLRDGATFRSFYRRSLVHFAQASIRAPSRRRLGRLFQTELAASHAAARAARLLEPGLRISLPYWEYHSVGDSRDCRSHEALNGFIARWNDLVWLTIYPPNGPRCRCEVGPLTNGAARRLAGERLRIPGSDRLPPRPTRPLPPDRPPLHPGLPPLPPPLNTYQSPGKKNVTLRTPSVSRPR